MLLRIKKKKIIKQERYPLVEWGVTEKQALSYCQKIGYDWGGLYKAFNRVSCFCCPLSGKSSMRTLRRCYPELWKKILDMENQHGEEVRQPLFMNGKTAHQLEKQFQTEDKKPSLNV